MAISCRLPSRCAKTPDPSKFLPILVGGAVCCVSATRRVVHGPVSGGFPGAEPGWHVGRLRAAAQSAPRTNARPATAAQSTGGIGGAAVPGGRDLAGGGARCARADLWCAGADGWRAAAEPAVCRRWAAADAHTEPTAAAEFAGSATGKPALGNQPAFAGAKRRRSLTMIHG